MPRRCYLHVGCPKTGTTYLQSILWKSRPQLAQQGLEPVLPQRGDAFFVTLGLRDRIQPEYDGPRVVQVMDRLKEALTDSRTCDLVLSHELLAAVPQPGIEQLKGMLGEFEVHVVVTARDLYRQIPAEWQQTVKTRSKVDYASFLDGLRSNQDSHFWMVQDVAGVAERWGQGLPPERVHVVTVPPSSAPRELLVERFFGVLGVDPATVDTDVEKSNPSLGFAQAELLRRLNVTLGERLPHPRAGYNVAVKSWLGERVLSPQKGERIGLPAQHHGWPGDHARATVERLRERGYHVVGDLEELAPPPPAGGDASLSVPDAELLDAALEALAAIVTERGEESFEKKRARAVAAPGGRGGGRGATDEKRPPVGALAARAARRLRGAVGR